MERRELFSRSADSVRDWLHPLARAEAIWRSTNAAGNLVGSDRRWGFFAGAVGWDGRRRAFRAACIAGRDSGQHSRLFLGLSTAALGRGAFVPVRSFHSNSANRLQPNRISFAALRLTLCGRRDVVPEHSGTATRKRDRIDAARRYCTETTRRR